MKPKIPFPDRPDMSETLLLALGKDNLPKNRGMICLPEEGSCEWWRQQRGLIAQKIMEWAVHCGNAHTRIKTSTHTFDYEKGIKCLKALLEFIDGCEGRQKKPWKGTYGSLPYC